jgi:Calcium binding
VTNSRRSTISNARLEAMVEEATVDCYNEEEQATGLFTMIEENLTVPFETRVLGVSVTVTDVDLTDSIQIVATCRRDGLRQAIPILDLPLPTPPPADTDWIEAYRRWLG